MIASNIVVSGDNITMDHVFEMHHIFAQKVLERKVIVRAHDPCCYRYRTKYRPYGRRDVEYILYPNTHHILAQEKRSVDDGELGPI